MIQESSRVFENELVALNTYVLSFESRKIAETVLPGQFVNIRAWSCNDPLLRRPFSVYRVSGNVVSIVFNIVGRGTKILSELKPGQIVDVLGPLGRPFGFGSGDFDLAILVGGGLGVAPLPILSHSLKQLNIPQTILLGARTKSYLIPQHLEGLLTATDDGSAGFSGTVVHLAREVIAKRNTVRPKIFGCGPTPMLRALSDLASQLGIQCEISLEGPMGCGFGICQGCPVKLREGEKEYALMCNEGPVFSSQRIAI